MEGFAVVVPVPVGAKKGADGKTTEFAFGERIGRFGRKCQEASLLNFSAGAYVTEMGITNPMQPAVRLAAARIRKVRQRILARSRPPHPGRV